MSEALSQSLDAFAERWLKSGRLPCLACAVSVDGQTQYRRYHGWQDKEAGTPLREDGVYWIASCTKAVTAVAALQLYEQGLWRLDDELAKFIPSFKNLPGVAKAKGELEPLKRPILMRDVVTHTAGFLPLPLVPTLRDGRKNFLQGKFYAAMQKGKVANLEDFIDLLASLPLVHQPGVAWEYGWSIDILGRVVEVLSGMKFDAYCDQYIFGPLGMSSTCFLQNLTPDLRSRMVQMYTVNMPEMMRNPKKFFKDDSEGVRMIRMSDEERANFTLESSPMLMPGGGLVSTLDDFMKFAQCLCSGGVGGPNHQRILQEKTIALMGHNLLTEDCVYGTQASFINGKPKDDAAGAMSVGVACVKEPEKTRMAPGAFEWGGITSTIFWVDPANKLAVVCFTQLGPFPLYPLRSLLKDLIYPHIGAASPAHLRSKL